MKKIKYLLAALALSFAGSAMAQEDSGNFFTAEGDLNESLPIDLPTSAPLEGLEPIELLNPRADDIYWSKIVWRIVDLREKFNYPFYFPVEAGDNRQNLFSLIFNLGRTGKIKLYRYDDKKEYFDNQHLVEFKEILRQHEIAYEAKLDSITNDTIFEVGEADIPAPKVLKYYLKEVWYFDKISSTFNCRIISLCPILDKTGEDGVSVESYPLFWIPFEKVRPFFAQQEVVITDKNNGARPSFDDIFMKRRFSGYIFRESNVMDRNLLEYNNDAQECHKEQARIKNTILNFENDLWEY
ncbi:MAG: gliding motility protein GldN [Paludibacteraceae bacterium]|nr:gliding motility protein GldN [Candidatus Physcocola equi]MCQ2234785.1 gliding motility protein GldN [Paludibacteraceae bacterium]